MVIFNSKLLVYQRVNSCWHLARSGSDSSLCFDTSDLGGESTRRGQNWGFTPFQRTSCRANVLSYSMFLSLKIHICSYIQYVHIYIYIYINGYVFLLSLSLSLRVGFPEIKSGSHQCVRCQKDAQMSRFCGWITCWRLNTSNGCVIYIYIYFNMFQLYSTHP